MTGRWSVLEMATADRRELLELLRDLTPAQWDAPTLCAGWAVRDVVAHVVSYDGLSPAQLSRRLVQGRFWLSRINAVALRELRDAPPEQLMAAVERNLRPSGLPSGFGGRIALTDGLVHQQDIRRPLGRPRAIPADRLREALRFALVAPPLRGAWRLRGLRAIAPDLDWSFGAGAEVTGTGEALLMALAGRRAAAAELTGPGAERLRARLG